MNPIQKFLLWLANTKQGEIVKYPLDEELIKKEEIIKALQQRVKGFEAQLARISADERKEKELEKEKDYTKELAERAQENLAELKKNKYKHSFSLRYLFNKMGYEKKPTKFGKEIDLTDKDDTTIFGKFNDIIVTDNGYIMVTDSKNNVMNISKTFPDLIWKPDGLTNYMKRKRLPLSVDESHNPVLDLEEEEHPEIIFDERRKRYTETMVRQRPVKQMLIEREEKFRELQNYTERIEKVKIDMEHTLNENKREIRLLRDKVNLKEVEKTDIYNKVMQMEKAKSKMERKNTKLTELNSHNDSMIEKYKEITKKLLDKLEYYGDQDMFRKVKAELQDDLQFYKNTLPEKVTVEHEKEVVRVPTQPGHAMEKG